MSISITNLTSIDIEEALKKTLSDDMVLISIAEPGVDESYEEAKFINDSSLSILISKTDFPTSWDQRVLKLAQRSKLNTMCDMIYQIHNAGCLGIITDIVKYYANCSEYRVNWLAVTYVLWKYEVLTCRNYRFIDSKKKLLDLINGWKRGN